MKRVIVAVLLLLVVSAGCTVSIVMQNRVIREFTAATDTMEERFTAGDVQGAVACAEAFERAYRAKTRCFSLFLPHDTLTEVEKSVISLPAVLTHGEHKDFVAEVRRCRLLLENMYDLELPTLQNVL